MIASTHQGVDIFITGLPSTISGKTIIRHKQSSKVGVQEGGLTFTEILVVIAIIALLMAILLPCLQRVKDQAKARWMRHFKDYRDGQTVGR